mgnify:CR=1 FL=1
MDNQILKEEILKLKDIEDNTDNVTIKTSSYRGKGDGHTHTHWLIVADGDIKLRSLKDFVNKTSITIEKHKINFENN